MNTYENYILKQIRRLESELDELIKAKDFEKPIYSKKDWEIKFHRISAQIDILYMVLTAHDNKYNKTN
jgi:hypothetical protein